MIRLCLTTLVVLFITGPALALSCLRPSVATTFAGAAASDATYRLVLGKIDLLPGQIPRVFNGQTAGEPYTLKARFSGRQGGTDGFRRPVAFPVTLDIGCAGPWCGSVPRGEVLMFVEARGADHALELGACPHFALPATPETIAQARQCLAGGPCTPQMR